MESSASEVQELTDLNFDRYVDGTSPWMIDVYAPWCGPCKALAPVWEDLARELKPLGIRVGRIDGPANKVSLQRLRVAHFPHLFHVIGDELREVPSMARSLEELQDFALTGWRSTQPRRGCSSPVSTCGRAIGAVKKLGPGTRAGYIWLHKEHGLSHVTICAMFLSLPLSLGLVLICVLDSYNTRFARGNLHQD